jgi:hypothetical protein
VSGHRAARSLAALILAALMGALANPLVAPAQQLDPPPLSDCGDSVYLTGLRYEAGIDSWSYKVVGVDLGRWLGNGGYGTMEGTQWSKAAGTEFWGPVNASANGGARTGTQVLEDPSMKGGNVHAWITGDNGIVRCEKWMKI